MMRPRPREPRNKNRRESGKTPPGPVVRQIGGDQAGADTALKNLITKQAGNAARQIAGVYALRKDSDRMFAQLDRAWRSPGPGISSLPYDPFLLRYKGGPRCAAFCRKVRLPAPINQKWQCQRRMHFRHRSGFPEMMPQNALAKPTNIKTARGITPRAVKEPRINES